MDLGLRDRVYLITGGSRGLGRATAAALVAEGARVVLSSRSEEAVTKAAADLGGPGHAVGIAADNADDHGAERLVAAAMARYGRLDGALVSVGGPPPGPVSQASEDDWRDAFESVFLGALRIAKAVAGAAGGGEAGPLGEAGFDGHDVAIAFVLSSSVRAPIPGLGISNGLRPGLAMAAKSLADELGPRGIRVLGLLPGRIATDRMRELDAIGGDPEEARARSAASIPLRRYGTPEEFGRVAAFVLSPAASYLSGTMIAVDGGATRSL
jgi:3-oxoacyl-[acyl-carrier protein] reductase